jgi:hypothetical protein
LHSYASSCRSEVSTYTATVVPQHDQCISGDSSVDSGEQGSIKGFSLSSGVLSELSHDGGDNLSAAADGGNVHDTTPGVSRAGKGGAVALALSALGIAALLGGGYVFKDAIRSE